METLLDQIEEQVHNLGMHVIGPMNRDLLNHELPSSSTFYLHLRTLRVLLQITLNELRSLRRLQLTSFNRLTIVHFLNLRLLFEDFTEFVDLLEPPYSGALLDIVTRLGELHF